MAKRKAKTEEEIKVLIQQELQNSLHYDREELSHHRSKAIDYFLGDMRRYLPHQKNRSSVVSKDISDVVGWMLPGIMRVFMASDSMVQCLPVGPADEDQAKQAGDYLNHTFMKDNDGYRIMHSATWDSLVLKNGIVKVWWDERDKTEITEHEGVTEAQLPLLTMTPGVEVLAASQEEDGTYTIKLKMEKDCSQIRYDSVEPENFGINRDADTIEEARFTWQREERTRSNLIEAGFNKKKVNEISAFNNRDWSTEDDARRQDLSSESHEAADESEELIEVFECYIRMDADGDGESEMVKATYAGGLTGGVILDWEIWDDDQPFCDIPCQPIPHRWDAVSIADETMDVQEVKTALWRQGLDNTYKHNNPQPMAKEGSVLNPDALVGGKFGQPIWMKKNADMPVQWTDTPYIADKSLAAIQHADQVIERRTGVSRSTMALDPETLQNQTATAAQLQHDSAYSKIELIARNHAELGWKKVFRKALKLLHKHQPRARMIRLRDEWVEIDPRYWDADMEVTINVGLGTGSRDRDIVALNSVLANQQGMLDRFTAVGMEKPALSLLPYIRKTLVKIAESAGLENADSFYPPMDEQIVQQMAQEMQQKRQQQQGQGDPKVQAMMQKAQMDNQLQQAKMQGDMQMKQAELQGKMGLEQQKMQAQQAREQAQMEADLVTQQNEAQIRSADAAQKLDLDWAKLQSDIEDDRNDNILNAERLDLDREIAEAQFGIDEQKLALDTAKEEARLELDENRAEIDLIKAIPRPEKPNGANK